MISQQCSPATRIYGMQYYDYSHMPQEQEFVEYDKPETWEYYHNMLET